MINISCRHDNLSPFKMLDFVLSSRQADNQLAGKSLKELCAYADFWLSRQIASQICDKYQNLICWLLYYGTQTNFRVATTYGPVHKISVPITSVSSKGSGECAHGRFTLYLIDTPFNAFAIRADPDQVALVRAA